MYDFNDVNATSKREQLRAWAIEQSMDYCRDAREAGIAVELMDKADQIEKFVLNGIGRN